VKLMDRKDSKFTFNQEQLPDLLEKLKEHYNILEIEGERLMHYSNYYYDTKDFSLYQRHHNKHLNRYKIRKRKYSISDQSYLEIKFKSNKSRTIKNRTKITEFSKNLDADLKKYINENSPLDPDNLDMILQVDFMRLTLAHKDFKDRATIDLELNYQYEGSSHRYENLAIAELKEDKSASGSVFFTILRESNINLGSFSKYCFGMLKLHPQLKNNLFKPKLRLLNKILFTPS